MRIVPELDFELRYDGDALRSGQMSATDLGSSLMHAARVLEHLNREQGINEPLGINVHALERGSFTVHLSIATVESLLTTGSVTAVVNLQSILTGFTGLVHFVKNGGRRAVVQSSRTTPGLMEVEMANGNRFAIPVEAFDAAGTVDVLRALQEVVRPVERDGVDSFEVIVDDVVVERVESDDIGEFASASVPMEAGSVNTNRRRVWLKIETAALEERLSWRLSDGATSFNVHILDEAFNESVAGRRENFFAGDRLDCELQETQTIGDDGSLSTRRDVIRVYAHSRAEFQPRLTS